MFLGVGEGWATAAAVIPGCATGADPESRAESSLSLDSGFTPSACPGMTDDSLRPEMTGLSVAPGITADSGAPGRDGACDSSRSHRYCATLVSWYSSTRMNLNR